MCDLKLMAERCIPEECKDDLVNRREVYRLKLMSVTDWDFGQALINLPSAEPEPKCNSCRYRNLEWYEEPCDSCTGGGEGCHYKPEPERLTDDDFETIRIHLNALKERLCNQRRWKEAEEYQRIIDRFMSFASAEPERKTGEWIYGEKSGQDGWYCSECGFFIPWYYDYYGLDNIDFISDYHTCPNCESRMLKYTGMREGEQDEND